MTDKEKNEVLFDAFLKIGVSEAYNKEIKSLPTGNKLKDYKPSPELEKRIFKLINQSYLKKRIRKYVKIIGRIAACICIIYSVSSTILLSVSATRNVIFNAIIEWQEKYTEIQFGDTSVNKDDLYRPAYLPNGYIEKSIDKFGSAFRITYANDANEEIFISQWSSNSGTSLINNENKEFVEIEMLNEKAYLFQAQNEDDLNVLIWQKNGMVFDLSSKIDVEEIIKIGESLKNS